MSTKPGQSQRKLELAAGDRILVRRNDKKRKLVNGQVLTVQRILPDGTIETVEGKLLPSGFLHFTHGYVVTSHKSQGSTVDHVVVAAERLDAKSAYVSCSRARRTCTVFTPDKEHLFAHLPRSADREAALDVLRAQAAAQKQNGQQNASAVREAAINPSMEVETSVEENEPLRGNTEAEMGIEETEPPTSDTEAEAGIEETEPSTGDTEAETGIEETEPSTGDAEAETGVEENELPTGDIEATAQDDPSPKESVSPPIKGPSPGKSKSKGRGR